MNQCSIKNDNPSFTYICIKCYYANNRKVGNLGNESWIENETVLKSLDEQFKDDTKELFKIGTSKSTSLDCLLNYDPVEWLEQRPAQLVEFLMQVTKINNSRGEKGYQLVCKITELTYMCRNTKIILPLSFQENILVFTD